MFLASLPPALWYSVPPNANVSMPSRTPAGGGFGHARITNAGHTRTARIDTCVDHDVCVMNWNRRHCVRGRCERHGKDNSNPLGHCFFSSNFTKTAQTRQSRKQFNVYRALHRGFPSRRPSPESFRLGRSLRGLLGIRLEAFQRSAQPRAEPYSRP